MDALSNLNIGLSVANSEYSRRGRLEEAKSYFSNCSVYDSESGALLMQMSGLRFAKLDTGLKLDPHTLNRIVWKHDITFLTQDQLTYLPTNLSETKIDIIIDLIAHKKPALKVLEINLDTIDDTSLWFEAGDASSRAAYLDAQTKHEAQRNSSFVLMNPTKEAFGLSQLAYDLVIIKLGENTEVAIDELAEKLKPFISEEGYTLFLEHGDTATSGTQSSSDENIAQRQQHLEILTNLLSFPQDLLQAQLASLLTPRDIKRLKLTFNLNSRLQIHSPWSLVRMLQKKGTFGAPEGCDNSSCKDSAQAVLQNSGWRITEQTYPFSDIAPGSVVLILHELFAPVLTEVSSEQWEALKTLISSGNNLLWVTKGAQHEVTNPDNALAHGLFRVIRMEDANAKLTTLDVQSSTSPATSWAIDILLKSLWSEVIPDDPINNFKRDEIEGAESALKYLHGTETAVALRAERLGTFQSLTWCETDISEVSVEANKLEVEVMAVGVNFKDLAVTMGIVPENEHTLGYEAAGVVKRLGPGVTKFQVPVGRVHVIPKAMAFEEAATIPSVYLASIYSLFDIANLKQDQSVLIHSAFWWSWNFMYPARSIYECREKRKFLADSYGIPENRMFSSRTTKFAKEILRETNGRGVDVIINSLVGEMLDESWRIVADGGTLVEIGKKDIVDRNMLSMEPFDRNCSFGAMDFSYTKDISDELIAKLLTQIFDLVHAGHIKPIHPITTFGFDDVPSASSCIRSGRHIGKVVISNGDKSDVQVPIRPALSKLALQSDASYLIVGGLKGLCGNLAIHMSQHGARHIIVISRSGLSNEASKKTVMNCLAYGREIREAKGDVTDVKFLRSVFKEASPGIAGVIRGAMILRDKPYETMTLEEYHAAIYGKIKGTWTNTFLGAFAKYRQSMGRRANAVDLGLIEDVGHVAEQGGMDSHFDKIQWTPIMEGTLRKILTYSILQQTAPMNAISSAQWITGIGFPLPDDSDLIREARFGHLFAQSASSGAGKEASQGDQTIRGFLSG
ncbi:KR domain-containing protein [Leptodontidium sp. MPI-SDFR-AT-0119]|nr:KR domain-containing protein [Leptodontidium sp. MPI-SDFR-AT-0119]